MTMQTRRLSGIDGGGARRGPGWRRALVALGRDLAGAWRHALARRHDAGIDRDIDDATLRDLGISRSELSSFRAEAEGRVERTRLRVLALHVGGS
jgi:hypothetical protein